MFERSVGVERPSNYRNHCRASKPPSVYSINIPGVSQMNLQSQAMNMVQNAASVGGSNDGGAIMSTDEGRECGSISSTTEENR